MRRLLACLLLGLLSSGPAVAWDYTNQTFGFGLEVPNHLKTCNALGHIPIQGFLIYLDGKPGICMETRRRQLAVLAFHNAPIPQASLYALWLERCETQSDFEPNSWQIGPQPALACYRPFSDGWVEVDIYALSAVMTEQKIFDYPTPAIEYTLHLRTRRETLIEDMKVTRALAASMRLFPPQQP